LSRCRTLVAFGDLISGDFQPTQAFPEANVNNNNNTTAAAPFILAMAHHPDCSDALMPYNISLLLSGHTHGGQVRLPVINTPVVSIMRAIVTLGPLRRLLGWRYKRTEAPYYALKDWSRGAGLLPLDRNTRMTKELERVSTVDLPNAAPVSEQGAGYAMAEHQRRPGLARRDALDLAPGVIPGVVRRVELLAL